MVADACFAVLLVGLPVIGFFQGIVRLMVVFVMFYLSVVLASLYFTSLGNLVDDRFSTDLVIGQFVSFVLVMGVSFVLLSAAGLYIFRHTKIPARWQSLDRSGGLLIGLILAFLAICLSAALLWNMALASEEYDIGTAPVAWIPATVEESASLGILARYLLPATYRFVGPSLPDSADIILEVLNHANHRTNPANPGVPPNS
ncbi:MAG: CvpA family protein [Chloroflexaceae bacterium]|nr:CvpA family protein [Chloroflexaceae bacterium]